VVLNVFLGPKNRNPSRVRRRCERDHDFLIPFVDRSVTHHLPDDRNIERVEKLLDSLSLPTLLVSMNMKGTSPLVKRTRSASQHQLANPFQRVLSRVMKPELFGNSEALDQILESILNFGLPIYFTNHGLAPLNLA
jgi:hypothetical protein